jgi:hypothetical protein
MRGCSWRIVLGKGGIQISSYHVPLHRSAFGNIGVDLVSFGSCICVRSDQNVCQPLSHARLEGTGSSNLLHTLGSNTLFAIPNSRFFLTDPWLRPHGLQLGHIDTQLPVSTTS